MRSRRCLDVVRQRLGEFRTLGPNWNGYGGLPPSALAVDECLRWMESLPEMHCSPVAMLSGNGEVGLLWERTLDQALVEVGFQGMGTYGFLAVSSTGEAIEAEGVVVDEPLPFALLEALKPFLA